MLIVHAHLHRRRTGVTSHTEAVARVQGAQHPVRILGGVVDPALPRIGARGVLSAARAGPVVLHAHRNLELLLGLFLRLLLRLTGPRGARLALVATRHGGGPPSWITRLLLRRADRVITLTSVAHAALPVVSEIVGHGVDLARFHPPPSRTHALAALALPPLPPPDQAAPGVPAAPAVTHAVGVVGRIRPAKGQGDFARAIAPLLDASPGWVPVVMGLAKGPDAAFAESLGELTHGRLQRLPERPDPAPVYRALTVLVQPSHAESFSLVLLEAMASGCCVIAAALPHYPELLQEGVTGLTYPVGDVEALRARLERVMRDPGLAERIGSAAAAHARAHFGVEREASALLGIYAAALKSLR